jgi:hypothetical protein
MPRPRSEILAQLTAEDKERLLEWFLESAADGWLPVMESWTTEVSGRYRPWWLPELVAKCQGLMQEVQAWHKQRGD